jgi:hypothetical protein
MDIEELVGLAVTEEACAYYGSRTAAPLAELVVMPYTSLLHKETRCKSLNRCREIRGLSIVEQRTSFYSNGKTRSNGETPMFMC